MWVKVRRLGTGTLCLSEASFLQAEPYTLVGSDADLGTGGPWLDPRLCQYSFEGLMIVIATGFIPLPPLSVVMTMVMLESRQWLGKSNVWSSGYKNPKKA